MISNFQKSVIELVIRKRREQGLRQEDLAIHLETQSSFISNIESYKKKLNLDHINKLAELFNCSPKDLIPDSIKKEN